jgi:hypothetical protein
MGISEYENEKNDKASFLIVKNPHFNFSKFSVSYILTSKII